MATIDLAPIARLSRDLRAAVGELTPAQARYLVDAYYQMQDYRIASAGQVRSFEKDQAAARAENEDIPDEPIHPVMTWMFDQVETMEAQVQRALLAWVEKQPVGRWLLSIYGIGPVIAAGILAHAPVEDHPTAGQLWAFAGLAPGLVWEKGQKRPWNATLKTLLAYKAGESFVKFCNRPDCYYGHIYAERKKLEIERNEAGAFADQAAEALTKKRYGDDTVAKSFYLRGMLPPAHIHARARRYAVKLFAAHYHEVAYVHHHGVKPPLPYPIAVLGHGHYLAPPPMPN